MDGSMGESDEDAPDSMLPESRSPVCLNADSTVAFSSWAMGSDMDPSTAEPAADPVAEPEARTQAAPRLHHLQPELHAIVVQDGKKMACAYQNW